MKRAIVVLVVLVTASVFGVVGAGQVTCMEFEEQFVDGFTLSFSLRGLFLDTGAWNAMIPVDSGLPELDGLVRFHGATVAVPTGCGLHFGMSGFGATLNEHNEYGYTTWNGALAGLSLEAIGAASVEDVYTHLRLALFCGTFNFSATGIDGTGVCGYGGAFHFEPSVGLSYQIGDSLFVQGSLSTILAFLPGNAWPGGRDIGPDVKPYGPMITITFGWRGLDW